MKGFSRSRGGEGGVRGGGKNADVEALGEEPPNLLGDRGVSGAGGVSSGPFSSSFSNFTIGKMVISKLEKNCHSNLRSNAEQKDLLKHSSFHQLIGNNKFSIMSKGGSGVLKV